jgi:hypothetical protein
VSGSGVFASSFFLLIRTHNPARCQAEILLSALCRFPEPALWTASPESRELLGEHFAKGEIDRNEYVERSKTFDLTAAAL